NIWKMSDIINGVKVEPGETWSINEEAGPRTYNLGWQGAPGISDGEYKEEAGGGICQVSSTLYNAVLRAELEIVERKHHSWPLDYIDGGLDATISTGAPDF
ncbi:MAG TPA: vanomycin resistance protein VanB, partial [Clostridiales bacterium]|nr:vanomycin resistance protein VanB [Clostridiales bacterium]